MANQSGKARNVCFTIHITDDEDKADYKLEEHAEDIMQDEVPPKYLVFQVEETKDGGKHYQGYIELKNPRTYAGIKKLFKCQWMHIEARKGTAKQASDYCKKLESRVAGPWEYGELSGQGSRTDIHVAVDKIKSGVKMSEVAREHPVTYVRYHRGFQALDNQVNPVPKRDHAKMRFYIWCGEPGIGKSWWAAERFPDAFNAMDTPNGWMDGYAGQDTIIFDEFAGQFPYQQMLKLIDGQALQLQTKGGFTRILATNIVWLSNMHLDAIYGGLPTYTAIQRRIQEFSVKHNICWVHGQEPENHPFKRHQQEEKARAERDAELAALDDVPSPREDDGKKKKPFRLKTQREQEQDFYNSFWCQLAVCRRCGHSS